MPVRSTMVDILAELRRMTDLVNVTDSSPDYDKFPDQTLQDILDRFARIEVRDWEAIPVSQLENGLTNNVDYDLLVNGPYFRYEDLTVVDSSGYEAVNYTVDYLLSRVTFTSDQNSVTYRVRGNGFMLNRAAAVIWKQKAALRAGMIQFKAGDHTLYEQQEYEHCLDMAKFYGGSTVANRRLVKVGYAPRPY